jgi:hypothetical protein
MADKKLNTYYYKDGNEIKKLETVKPLEFIRQFINKNAVESIQSIAIPDGYTLNGMTIEPTSETVLQQEIDTLKNWLALSDTEMARVYEDMMDVLIDKSIFKKTDFPIEAQAKFDERKSKRAELQAKLSQK